jgi:hypothetical protein
MITLIDHHRARRAGVEERVTLRFRDHLRGGMSGSPDRPVRVNVERDRHAPRRCDEGHAAVRDYAARGLEPRDPEESVLG